MAAMVAMAEVSAVPQGAWPERACGLRKAVVFCCDGAFFPYAAHAAVQIAAQAPGPRDFDICICMTQAASLPEALYGHGIKIIEVDQSVLPKGLSLDSRRSLSTYMRLFLVDFLGDHYERILYLDSDIWVSGGDFSALLGQDPAPHAVACVRDNQQWRRPRRKIAEFADFSLREDASYFNAGVMLISTQEWRRQGLSERIAEFACAHGGRLRRNDQSLLNCVLHGHWAELSPLWNWQYTWASRMFEPLVGANVIHFIGPNKPWKANRGEIPQRYHRAFARFLQLYFPDVAAQLDASAQAGIHPLANEGYLRRMLVKHLLTQRATARYLARFPDDLTILK